MKFIKRILAILIITGTFTLGSCFNGDDIPPEEPVDPIDLLPPLTFEGNNTFGALINGEALVVRTTGDVVAIFQRDDVLGLTGGSPPRDSIQRIISIRVRERVVEGRTYDLTNYPNSFAEYSDSSGFPEVPTCRYEGEDTIEGSFTIEFLDRINFIIAGTFEFTTVNNTCDTIRVTDGRFDIRYIP